MINLELPFCARTQKLEIETDKYTQIKGQALIIDQANKTTKKQNPMKKSRKQT